MKSSIYITFLYFCFAISACSIFVFTSKELDLRMVLDIIVSNFFFSK